MKNFIYKAKDKAGKFHRGHMVAEDEQTARDVLTSKGYHVQVFRFVEETTTSFHELAMDLEGEEEGN